MVRLETWASILGDAMCEFFDCQVYTTTFGTKVEFSFYGASAFKNTLYTRLKII